MAKILKRHAVRAERPGALPQESSAWRGSSIGAFQNAMMQSPMYLSIVPWRSMISLVIGERKPRLIRRLSPCGFDLKLSEIEVKPRMSENMIESIRGRAMLEGARGTPAVNIDAIADALLRLSSLMVGTPSVQSVDLNPVLAYPDGLQAVLKRSD